MPLGFLPAFGSGVWGEAAVSLIISYFSAALSAFAGFLVAEPLIYLVGVFAFLGAVVTFRRLA